ncbi:MAG: CocE/NonD family hydrolase [Armatimonadetes bacterium]|jgi:putative CocE/NonD family hydrolase|nr:CocE/NonD family hydrolase [Armatimonadota bacterium]
MQILRNVKVPMRDGVRLATTIFLPGGEGRFPVVLVRTAYNRVGFDGRPFTERGMALVIQDCRGRYDSEGQWYPFINEEDDGWDTLEWLGQQPWCNGKVGMFGDSYLAATQLYLAPTSHPLLHCLNPRFMAGDPWKHAYYCDGVFSLGLTWSWLCFETNARTSEAALMPLFDVPGILRQLPLLSLDEASGAGVVPWYRDYVQHAQYDAHWRRLNVRDQAAGFRVPALLIGGWYDYYSGETFANYLALRENAATPELRDAHRVLVGPWTHGMNPHTVLGELDFGEQSLAENDATLRWLDCLLHGGSPADFQEAPLRLFVMGRNEWRDEWEWPLARTRFTDYYLHPGGRLATDAPGTAEPDRYLYDPNDPVPTLGGNHSVGPYNPGLYELALPGPYDQRPIEARPDVLTFTSEPLPEDLEVTGPVTVTLYASSSAPDTDFVARLTDVYPDGRSINITEGALRARFREDVWGEPKLMEPGRVYAFTLDLQATSNVFRKGHCLRVQVTSSNFPLWDRNLNTGAHPGTDTEPRVAQQTIYHDREHPSRITLPVIPA